MSSFLLVALAEMGDKTQLVAFSMAARYRALASYVGAWGARRVLERTLEWILGLGFIVFAVWTLYPDTAGEPAKRPTWGPLVSTAVALFLAEMGDKTQLATVALGARFGSPVIVTAGTTLGMLAADALAVFAGTYTAMKVPMV